MAEMMNNTSESPRNKNRMSRILLRLLIVFVLLVGIWGLFLNQIGRAEAGRSNYVPRRVKSFIAAREYEAAKNSQYEDARVIGYLKVVNLDGDHFPDAWAYLCKFYSSNREWAAARLPCERAAQQSRAEEKSQR